VRYEYDSAGRLAAAFDRRELANRYDYDSNSRISREILKDGAVYSYRYVPAIAQQIMTSRTSARGRSMKRKYFSLSVISPA